MFSNTLTIEKYDNDFKNVGKVPACMVMNMKAGKMDATIKQKRAFSSTVNDLFTHDNSLNIQ